MINIVFPFPGYESRDPGIIVTDYLIIKADNICPRK